MSQRVEHEPANLNTDIAIGVDRIANGQLGIADTLVSTERGAESLRSRTQSPWEPKRSQKDHDNEKNKNQQQKT